MPFPMINYPSVPPTWVLVYQRSHLTKITEVKRNLTQFIGGKFNHNFISIVIGSWTSGIKTPFQLTTLNVMGASPDLFDVSMEICHGKFTLGNVGHTHLMQFPVVKGSPTLVKVLRVSSPIMPLNWEVIISEPEH